MRSMVMNAAMVIAFGLAVLTPKPAIADSYYFYLGGFTNWDGDSGAIEGTFSFEGSMVGEDVELSELDSFRVSYLDEEVSYLHNLENLQSFIFYPLDGVLTFRTHGDVNGQMREKIVFDMLFDYYLIQLLDTTHPDYNLLVHETAGYDAPTLFEVEAER